MKSMIKYALVAFFTIQIPLSFAESSGNPPFLGTVGKSDVAGIGKYARLDGEHFTRIENITYWFGDLGTNSIVLTPLEWLDGELFFQDVKTNDTVVFFGIRQG